MGVQIIFGFLSCFFMILSMFRYFKDREHADHLLKIAIWFMLLAIAVK